MIGIGAVHRQLARVFGPGSVAGLDEHQLLSRFVDRGDESAFEAILARHGPMVLGVCRRSLGAADAEDAFQAVFLILVKKARTLRHRDALGPWLYGVARRVASRASKQAARRRRRESPSIAAEHAEAPAVDSSLEVERIETRAAIDDALASLPARFRAPMVLCYLEGLTHDEAASRLNIPVGTVRSRMAWARGRLKIKLARRGLVAPASLVMAETIAEAAVSPALVQATLKAALSIVAGQGAAAGVASAASLSLMKGVLTTMMLNKLKVLAVGMLIVGGLAGGGAAVGRQFGGGQTPGKSGDVEPKPTPTAGFVPDPELMKAEAEIARAEAELESAKAHLAQLLRVKAALKKSKVGAAAKPAEPLVAAEGLDHPGGAMGKRAEPKASEMQNQQHGNLIIGFNRDRGRVRVVDVVRQTSKSYQAPGNTKALPITGLGDGIVSLLLEGPEITEVAVYKPSRGQWDIQKLGTPVRGSISPMVGPSNTSLVALAVEGPRIDEIVAYSFIKERWSLQKLREPTKGKVWPQIHYKMAIYRIDRRLYAFSDETGMWDILELPDDSPTTVDQTKIYDRDKPRYTVLQGDFLYTFNLNIGKWSTTSLEEKK